MTQRVDAPRPRARPWWISCRRRVRAGENPTAGVIRGTLENFASAYIAAMRSIILAFALVSAAAALAGDCPNSGYDDASISANGVTRVVIAGPSDLLLVTGTADAKEIRAMGSRCLPHGELTAGFRLTATRTGNTVRIEAAVTKHQDWPAPSCVITVPKSMAVDVVVSGGKMHIRDVAAVRLAVADGTAIISGISGSVTIDEHRSGSIRVMDVGGDLVINRSIAVDYERIAGRVISN